MPYCSNCGTVVMDTDRFCPKCGRGQSTGATPPPSPSAAQPVTSLQPSTAALLCYIPGLGWVAAIIFLALHPYQQDRYVRFHAFQGLYLAVLSLLVHVFFFPFPMIHGVWMFGWSFRRLMGLLVLAAQIIGIVKCAKRQDYRLPILSELADKSLA